MAWVVAGVVLRHAHVPVRLPVPRGARVDGPCHPQLGRGRRTRVRVDHRGFQRRRLDDRADDCARVHLEVRAGHSRCPRTERVRVEVPGLEITELTIGLVIVGRVGPLRWRLHHDVVSLAASGAVVVRVEPHRVGRRGIREERLVRCDGDRVGTDLDTHDRPARGLCRVPHLRGITAENLFAIGPDHDKPLSARCRERLRRNTGRSRLADLGVLGVGLEGDLLQLRVPRRFRSLDHEVLREAGQGGPHLEIHARQHLLVGRHLAGDLSRREVAVPAEPDLRLTLHPSPTVRPDSSQIQVPPA